MNKEINVLSMFRNKNKLSYFSMCQFNDKVKEYDSSIKINFHIIWDDNQELNGLDKKYEKLTDDEFGKNITCYSKKDIKSYCKKYYNINEELLKKFDNFYLINRIILGHYLRRVKLVEHFIILDDDILINDNINDIIECSLNEKPFLLTEPMNQQCDKILFDTLAGVYGKQDFYNLYISINPNLYGFNAGFQGVDASIFDDFLSIENFNLMLSFFDYSTTKNEDGTERFNEPSILFKLCTQEQSFFGLLNVVKSRKQPFILDPNKYYVMPNWGEHPKFGPIDSNDSNEGWTFALNSKITHFIGHTMGKGKPQTLIKKIDKYLENKNV